MVKRGAGKKIGFYEMIAERIATAADDENPMERGLRLEQEAIDLFTNETGMKVDTSLILWQREDDESIAISPDGVIDENNAVEVKCLSSARHIEALLTQKIPDEYEFQILQYFIVNDALERVYMIFYDPRLTVKSFFYLTIERDTLEQDIQTYLAYQKNTIQEVNDIVNSLTF